MAFKVRPRRNGKFQAIVEASGFPPVCGTFLDEASARAWAFATNTTVLSGGFLPLKPKARALVKVVLAAYETSELPTQASTNSSRSYIRALIRLLGDVTLANLTVAVLEVFNRIRMGSALGAAKGRNPEPSRATHYWLNRRAKRPVPAGEQEKVTVSSQSCQHEVALLQRAVRWWSYQHDLALEKRGHGFVGSGQPVVRRETDWHESRRRPRQRDPLDQRDLGFPAFGSSGLADGEPPSLVFPEAGFRRRDAWSRPWEVSFRTPPRR